MDLVVISLKTAEYLNVNNIDQTMAIKLLKKILA
jgi:hypothetical protein